MSGNYDLQHGFPVLHRKYAKVLIPLFAVLIFAAGPVSAQNDPPEDLVPPPISVVSDSEKEQLEDEIKVGNRTKLAIRFIEKHMVNSEERVENDEYEASLNELGSFRALMNDTVAFLLQNSDRKSTFKYLKRFERDLKEFIPRLELVRREMPYKYGYHVKELIRSVKDTREKLIEPFYGDTVIPDSQ